MLFLKLSYIYKSRAVCMELQAVLLWFWDIKSSDIDSDF